MSTSNSEVELRLPENSMSQQEMALSTLDLITAEVIEKWEGVIGTHYKECYKVHAACYAVFVRDLLIHIWPDPFDNSTLPRIDKPYERQHVQVQEVP